MPWYFSPALALVRKVAAAHHQADIRGKAMPLADTDQRAADRLNAAAAPLSEFDLPGGKGGVPGAGPGTDPKITGLPGPLVQDDDQAHLNSTLPGSDIEISGDGRSRASTPTTGTASSCNPRAAGRSDPYASVARLMPSSVDFTSMRAPIGSPSLINATRASSSERAMNRLPSDSRRPMMTPVRIGQS